MKDHSVQLSDLVLLNSNDAVPELSFVIPALNESDRIAETVRRVCEHAALLVSTFEVLIIDDGSTDDTFQKAKVLSQDFPVRAIRLSRNFGKEQAISAGLGAAQGRAVVILDADLQEPLFHLRTMLDYHAQGYEMIYTVRKTRADESWRKRFFTKSFYSLLNYGSEAPIPANARDFRLMDRRVVDALCALPERNRFMIGLYGWVGFRSVAIPIHLEPRRSGDTKFGMRNLFRLGITGMTSFTE